MSTEKETGQFQSNDIHYYYHYCCLNQSRQPESGKTNAISKGKKFSSDLKK